MATRKTDDTAASDADATDSATELTDLNRRLADEAAQATTAEARNAAAAAGTAERSPD